ncbi:MAG: acriflavine resistance protein B [Candidatus Melainabacteria bacterium]|nr:MAG: acriflavine resistance protein B [Candidatus Melainabacteria bacterium]
MNISRIFILRPIMTTLVMCAFVVFGWIAYKTLPVNDLPNVDFPTILVTATLPGANADTMASAVATPLEKQFATIAGLDSMSSQSALGLAQITLQFNLSRDMDGAALDVQSAIAAASKQLPPQMTTPPTFSKVNPANQPILYLALSSPTLPLYKVDEYAETLVAQRISRVGGVAQVQVNGAQVFAVHVQANPEKLAAYQIGMDDLANAISQSNVNMPTGTLYGHFQAFSVQANGQLFDAAAYKPIIISYRNGSPVRVQDVANVIDSVQNDKTAGWYNDTPGIILAVMKQPGANTIAVVNSIKKLLPGFRSVIPENVKLDILYDHSQTIRDSVNDVQLTLLLTVFLVVAVIYLFLGNISATIIPSFALPISIIGTFAAMHFFNFSLNNLTLMALTLSVGFVVDDAIVVLENIVRHLELGDSALESSLIGSREIGFTIVSMTLSLVAVFIPVLLMQGVVGKLFFEFAVTISVAILISGFISLSLTPMLCSKFLRAKKESERPNAAVAFAEKWFGLLLSAYETALKWALSNRLKVVGGFVIMFVATVLLFTFMPKGFMPSEDQGQIVGITQAPQGISFDDMVKHHRALSDIIKADPNVQSFMSSVGTGTTGNTVNASPNITLNSGRFLIVLKPRGERKLTADQVIEELRPKLAAVPGITIYLQNPPTVSIGGQVTKAVYQFTLSSPKADDLYVTARAMQKQMESMKCLQDVNSDLQIDNPQVNVQIDRDKCSELGVTMQQVEDALNNAYSARQVSTIYTSTNEFWVIMEVEPRFYRRPSSLDRLYIRSTTGQLVPLSTVAQITVGLGPLLINHLGQFKSVTISFNLTPGYSLGDAVSAIRKAAKAIAPPTVTTAFQGTAQEFEVSFGNLWALLAVAVFVIYIVLGILYESFIHPITILSGLPSAGLGALLVLLLFRTDLNIYGFLGLIMLIGIVKKNAIMMIDFALDAQRSENKPAEQAIFEACLIRFRPIMMTTMAALMGSIPIAVGLGAGSESRQPLGLTVVGGLLVSQMVTLFITPVFYIYLDKFQRKILKRSDPAFTTPVVDSDRSP